MTGEDDRIDVPLAGPGEAFVGELPGVADATVTEPGWIALSALLDRGTTRSRAAVGAAMAGAFIRTMRTTTGMSQTQLSQASGIAQSVISDIERGVGKIGPSFATMVRLASACGMEIGFGRVAGAQPAVRPARSKVSRGRRAALGRVGVALED
jgi:DNA-binding XRE family transcriptional regulator